MDRQKLKAKLQGLKKGMGRGLAGAVLLAIVGVSGYYGYGFLSSQVTFHADQKKIRDIDRKLAERDLAARHKEAGMSERVRLAMESVQEKADLVSQSIEENHRLQLENASLRRWIESIRFDCSAREAIDKTRRVARKLRKDTGSRVGRVLASIQYTPPGHLLPEQLFTLGVSYFKAREDEKAAVIFTFLSEMEEDDSYKTPRNFLLTGVSWYRLKHFKLAGDYFEKVLQTEDTDESLGFKAQARLWSALTAQREEHGEDSQHWLRELVDHHPFSMEASWINPGHPGGRVPASRKKSNHSEKSDHGAQSEHGAEHGNVESHPVEGSHGAPVHSEAPAHSSHGADAPVEKPDASHHEAPHGDGGGHEHH